VKFAAAKGPPDQWLINSVPISRSPRETEEAILTAIVEVIENKMVGGHPGAIPRRPESPPNRRS
jgi:hypothetical protein